MTNPHEIQEKFWESLKSDMTMMLGLVGVEESHTRPMTAQLDGQHGPIWFFTSTEALLSKISEMGPALSQLLHLRATISSHPFTDQLSLTTIAPPLTRYGTILSRPGTSTAKRIPSLCYCA